jgi:hypothetical protein
MPKMTSGPARSWHPGMTTASKEDIQHMRPKQRNKYRRLGFTSTFGTYLHLHRVRTRIPQGQELRPRDARPGRSQPGWRRGHKTSGSAAPGGSLSQESPPFREGRMSSGQRSKRSIVPSAEGRALSPSRPLLARSRSLFLPDLQALTAGLRVLKVHPTTGTTQPEDPDSAGRDVSPGASEVRLPVRVGLLAQGLSFDPGQLQFLTRQRQTTHPAYRVSRHRLTGRDAFVASWRASRVQPGDHRRRHRADGHGVVVDLFSGTSWRRAGAAGRSREG